MLRPQLHVQQSQEVIDLRERGHGALSASAARTLLDCHRGRNPVDGIHVRAGGRLYKLPRVSVQGLEITTLPFVEQDVERKS